MAALSDAAASAVDAPQSQVPDYTNVRAALLDVLDESIESFHNGENGRGEAATSGIVDWDRMNEVLSQSDPLSFNDAVMARLSERLRAYLESPDGALSEGSDDEDQAGAREEAAQNTAEEAPAGGDASSATRVQSHRRYVMNEDTSWFPWPNKETCVLDILRHIPRCAFSDKQNAVIHWALCALEVKNLPTEHAVQQVTKALQELCGVASIRYQGVMGHVYYVNDLAQLIAQEMANPRVRPHLRFLPEDANGTLSEAWQGDRWLKELDPDLATPMVRKESQDFYIYEPAQLDSHDVCMPTRWFTRGSQTYAKVWRMERTPDGQAWVVLDNAEFDVPLQRFLVALPGLIGKAAHDSSFPDPRHIIGIQDARGGIHPWTATNPASGNRWRTLASGHRVVAFPIWLNCDDTSGNLSKKWNKHNSFLFTPAGLPRRVVHHEYNIHFLATSNIAPPLEMLDGVVDQLLDCQRSGIWAWDCESKEPVLVIPSVLAMLGDNPMQSEIACHVGLAGKLFCRVCKVSRSRALDAAVATGSGENAEEPRSDAYDDDSIAGRSSGDSDDSGSISSRSVGSGAGNTTRRKRDETMAEMVDRVRRFMSIGTARTRTDTLANLKSQFVEAQQIGGQANVKKTRTATGIKDSYQSFFLDKLFAITARRGTSREQRTAEVMDFLTTVPHIEDAATSPVWRIRNFDPHADTPVEILHVILLGFVKYLWRDTVSRLKEPQRNLLVTRLSSFDVSGLGVPPLAGSTLVTYARSLVGRDFRAIAQAAPFVLHGLPGIPDELQHVWVALSRLIPLVWQPEIKDISAYMNSLTGAIDHFLNATCALTPRWFNKPKFHIILHLPAHIRRFGPAMLFATEGFESFNAVIRSHSIHSNHRAPSRDIAAGMAQHNRVRHLLSGGWFRMPRVSAGCLDEVDEESSETLSNALGPTRSPWLRKLQKLDPADLRWRHVGPGPLGLLALDGFDVNILSVCRFTECFDELDISDLGRCRGMHDSTSWTGTLAFRKGVSSPALYGIPIPRSARFRSADKILLDTDGIWCDADGKSWILWSPRNAHEPPSTARPPYLGRLLEILLIVGSPNEPAGKADFVLVELCAINGTHPYYGMPNVACTSRFALVAVRDVICPVNVQHNCVDGNCTIAATRAVWQERERTSQRVAEIHHHGARYILNTAQMRSSASIMPLYPPLPSSEDRETVILRAVMHEIELRTRRRRPARPPILDTSGDHNGTSQVSFSHPPVTTSSQPLMNTSISPGPLRPAQFSVSSTQHDTRRQALLSSYRLGQPQPTGVSSPTISLPPANSPGPAPLHPSTSRTIVPSPFHSTSGLTNMYPYPEL
ncbi:hypothetical protein BV20DRAFT_18264 [Pilatotrama ljubarskyi]|nr:hypothetical protein BV20DRAFT_18264 [Pilatotrama ljubarskyi]